VRMTQSRLLKKQLNFFFDVFLKKDGGPCVFPLCQVDTLHTDSINNFFFILL